MILRLIAKKYVFQLRSVSVDLNVDPSLQIDIPDALSERDKVKFTVHTKVSDRMTPVIKTALGCILVTHGGCEKRLPEIKWLPFICSIAPLLSEHFLFLVGSLR